MQEQKDKKGFWKRHWSDILLMVLIILFLIPQTRQPMEVAVNRILAPAPSQIAEEKREFLTDYQWQLRKLSGETVSFEEAKGEVAVVNLWATWCPPCIAEMPSFQKVYNDYGGEVAFYFISQEDQEKLKTFLIKREFDIPVYQALNFSPEQLESNSLPTTFVISKTGKIVIEKIGAADWNSQGFRELLDKLVRQ